MTAQDWNRLVANQDSLMNDIHDTCQWGTGKRWGEHPTETGMARLALSEADKQVRNWFVDTTQSLGCKVHIDEMGNIFAIRPGKIDAAPTYAGSHLDTQPAGGRYDGILGVTAAIQMLRVLHDNKVETTFPVGVVNWTNEEGARFPMSMVASGVWAQKIPLSAAHELKEVGGGSATMKSALQSIGYLGSIPCSFDAMPMAAHFELHIEQGPILQTENMKIGVVQGAQSYKWYTVTVSGRECHTGTTPFSNRSDALLAASKMILQSHRIATKLGALASTGIVDVKPGSVNTVPGSVIFSLDVRAKEDQIVENVEKELEASFKAIAEGKDVDGLNTGCTPPRSCTVTINRDFTSPAVNFHPDCIKCVEDSAAEILSPLSTSGKKYRPITSGAGHDTVYTSKICPSSMIFIPCRDGVSHNPEEYSTPEDCALGASVLMQSVLRYDRLRWERGEGK